MSGNFVQEKILRNKVNRAATKLRYDFYQKHVTALSDTGSHDWWKNMKKLMGIEANDSSKMQGLANKVADGNCEMLANSMNEFFVSVSEHLPRLNVNNEVFAVEGELPDEFIISIQTTFKALRNIKSNKASGPDNTPAWVLKDHAALLAPPLTAIFNCSLREGKLPNAWKMANIIPLPKSNPPASIHKDIRPISLTSIAAKVFESIVMEWVDNTIVSNVDPKQFGGLVEMTHKWYEATDTLNTYVRIVLLDFSKAFDLINHNILLGKLQAFGISAPILRWMAAFLLDRTQRVKIGNNYSHTGHPNGGVPQGTICGPKCFMMYINDLSTPVPLYKYVDDSTLFEICEMNSISLMQESVDIAAEWTKNNDMKMNSEKSKEMIISYAHGNIGNEVPNTLIDGKVVERVDHVKLLGITLSNDLTWKRHVDNIVKKAGKRIYMLYQLKRAGVNQTDLVTIYISVVKPVVEYACPVWHMIQKRAVRAIFPGMSYVDILNHINLSTLKERRDYLCKKYFINMQARSHKVNCLLPKKRLVDYNLRHGNMYPLTVTRTNRFKNSLIPLGLYHWQ